MSQGQESPAAGDRQARRQYRRVALWGLTNAIRQSLGQTAGAIAKQQGGQDGLPPQVAQMLDEVPFGNQVTIQQTPAPPATLGSGLAKWLGPLLAAGAIGAGGWWYGRESAPEPAPIDAVLQWEIEQDGARIHGSGSPAGQPD